jgi:hypothetical protein
MILALALACAAQTSAPEAPSSTTAVLVEATATLDPSAAPEAEPLPPLPSDDDLRLLAADDIGVARSPLRRAARTAPSGATRALAVRLLATNDASLATARICARTLRLDVDVEARRAAAECLGRLGPKLSGPQTPQLLAALNDPAIDVVTMAGWALSNVGDAAAVGPLAERISHPDVRVGRLFHGYSERLRDRLNLRYGADITPGSASAPTSVPPGGVLAFGANNLDAAASTAWLGIYGAMVGWLEGPLVVAAHGGTAGGDAAPLAALGVGAITGAAMSAYGFARAPHLPLAHTVVQFGTFGTLAGYGAGQLAKNGAPAGVLSADAAVLGTLLGTGVGMILVETAPPSMGALAAGMTAAVGVGAAGATLTAANGDAFDKSLGALLFAGSVAGAGTTLLLGQQDIGLFPVVGAAAGFGVGAGAGIVVASSAAGSGFTDQSGWIVVAGMLAGAAGGGVLAAQLPGDLDPLLSGRLKLNAPSLAVLPALGGNTQPAAVAMLSGAF